MSDFKKAFGLLVQIMETARVGTVFDGVAYENVPAVLWDNDLMEELKEFIRDIENGSGKYYLKDNEGKIVHYGNPETRWFDNIAQARTSIGYYFESHHWIAYFEIYDFEDNLIEKVEREIEDE